VKLAWLSQNVPYPPNMGVLQRNYHLIRQLSRRAEVHLFALRQRALCPDAASLDLATRELSSFCHTVRIFDLDWETSRLARAGLTVSLLAGTPYDVARYSSRALSDHLATLSPRGFDAVHVDTLGLVPYLRYFPGIPCVLNHHNIESHMLDRRAENAAAAFERVLYRWQASRTRAWERRWGPRFTRNLVVSDVDRQRLARIAPEVRLDVISNGVDVEYFDGPSGCGGDEKSVVMVGSQGWYPNRDAALWFLDAIWPRILAGDSRARWIVIGSDPAPRITEAARRDTRIEVLGFVDDLRPIVARAAVFVCPYREGGGSRLKVLDALAMRKALVSTAVGVEGIPLEDGREFLLATSPEAFADRVLELLADPARRVALGCAGRARVERDFAWPRIGEALAQIYREVTDA
jgi:glycosyltransferase involved in cell wall biosynthesis